MQKNNIKSFICSFLFSILAVFAVQKVFLHTDQSKLSEEKPLAGPSKHKISLFAENKSPQSRKIPVLVVSKQEKIDTVKNISQPVLSAPVLSVSANSKQDLPQKQEQLQSFSVPTDLASAEEITFSEQEQNELNEQTRLNDMNIVYADISDTFEPQAFKTADSSVNDEIPLVEDNIAVHSQINLQNGAQASQIAMIEPSMLINSIQEPDILAEDKNLAEADIKKSELGELTSLSDNHQEIDETAWDVATSASENTSVSPQITEDVGEDIALQEDSPWVIAKGNKYAKNQAVIEAFAGSSIESEFSQEDTAEDLKESSQNDNLKESEDLSITESKTLIDDNMLDVSEQTVIEQTFNEPLLKEKENNSKLAYEMIQNILIPIPDSIINDADIIPDLTASPDGVQSAPRHPVVPKTTLDEKEKQSGLFKNISSWFSKNKNNDEKAAKSSNDAQSSNKNKDEKGGTFQNLKNKVYSALGSVEDYKNLNDVSIMPAELRLSFAPNRAEISGQTLKWIYAFADNARDHNDVYIEVRIDGTSSYTLQQKRLNLLSSIFASRGVDYRKINTIFTSREPNSFIIRNIRFNNDSKGETNE